MILPLVEARWRHTTRYPGVLRGASFEQMAEEKGDKETIKQERIPNKQL